MSVVEDGEYPLVVWGRDTNRVTQRVGQDVLGLYQSAEPERVQRDDGPAFVMPIGDPGVGETAFAFKVNGCLYTVWVQPSVDADAVRAFVANY